jgi:hypothetical protein
MSASGEESCESRISVLRCVAQNLRSCSESQASRQCGRTLSALERRPDGLSPDVHLRPVNIDQPMQESGTVWLSTVALCPLSSHTCAPIVRWCVTLRACQLVYN